MLTSVRRFPAAPVAAMLALAAIAATCLAQDDSAKRLQDLVKHLKRQESLARSARATFDDVREPTTADNAALLRASDRKSIGNPDRYILDKDFVDKNSFTVRWLRKGVKERLEYARYRGADAVPAVVSMVRMVSFDGTTVRRLSYGEENPFGEISAPKDAHWMTVNRTQPWSLIYEWYGKPYSRVVSDCKDAKLATVSRNGRAQTELTLPKQGGWLTPVLVFDEDDRMVARRLYGKLGNEPERLYSRVDFSGYRRHPGPGGEAIWFPYKAVYRRYAHVGGGKVVEYGAEKVTVRSIEFNVDIPDEAFALRFPPGTNVHDSTRPGLYSLVIAPGDWLTGKPLPSLEGFSIQPAGAIAPGKPVAVCFCDLQQRPSRHAVTELADRASRWKQRGLAVVLIIPGGRIGDASTDWLKRHKVPFAVGRLPADPAAAKRAQAQWGVTALPHITLTDDKHIVTAEGIPAERIEAVTTTPLETKGRPTCN